MAKIKREVLSQDEEMADLTVDDQESIINIVVPSDGDSVDPNGSIVQGRNVPLFLKKLWKIVNDEDSNDIISWNEAGDGFTIHDQLGFVSKTCPKYFRHNNLSSFVRQLNLYDFHKIQNAENNDKYLFGHPCFLKDVPQLLPLIKRKITGRTKPTPHQNESSVEFQEVMNIVEDMRNKNDAISNEMSKLRQENAALWGEMNSLRVKYTKQTKIINKLIHFLISYMQKHHNSRKSGRTVSAENSNKYLKTGPKIMELDYKYKNNPHEFWSDFDNRNIPNEQGEQQNYTVVEPGEDQTDIGEHSQQNPAKSPAMSVSSVIEELLPGSSPYSQTPENSNSDVPSSSKSQNSALKRTTSTADNLGYFIDNLQIELSTIKELFKNISSDDMTTLCKMVTDNYKPQDSGPSSDLTLCSEDEITEKDLVALEQLSPMPNQAGVSNESTLNTPQIDLTLENGLNQNPFEFTQPDLVLNSPQIDSILNTPNLDSALNTPVIESSLNTPQFEDQLNTDELLNNISVDQYFNID